MALSTNFVTGMAAGTLPLHEYRKFLVQDAAYFLNVAEVYGKNAKLMEGKNEKFASFYWQQSLKFNKLHEDFLKDKVLPEKTDQVGEALRRYMEFQRQVDPELLAIAMLPCSMLYPELASIPVQNPIKNVYEEDWFKENRRDDESSTEKFVNANLAIEETGAAPVFVRGMLHELNFIREVGNQRPLTLKEVDQLVLL